MTEGCSAPPSATALQRVQVGRPHAVRAGMSTGLRRLAAWLLSLWRRGLAGRRGPRSASSTTPASALVLAAPARRIVSLAPHLTELLFAAGAGDRVVGRQRLQRLPERSARAAAGRRQRAARPGAHRRAAARSGAGLAQRQLGAAAAAAGGGRAAGLRQRVALAGAHRAHAAPARPAGRHRGGGRSARRRLRARLAALRARYAARRPLTRVLPDLAAAADDRQRPATC